MKVCAKCNAPIPKGVAFCTSCGTPVPKEEPKFNKKTILIGVIALFAVIAVICVVVAVVNNAKKNKFNTFNPMSKIEVKVEGYDGLGTASYKLPDDFYQDLLESFSHSNARKVKKANASSQASVVRVLESAEADEDVIDFIESIDFEFDNDKELKNGDKVVLSIVYDEDLAKDLKIKFTSKSTSVDVKDLTELKEIDAFDYINVTWTGVSPNLTAKITKEGSPEISFDYKFVDNVSTGLAIGDEINVEVLYPSEETLAKKGYKLKSKTKSYKIDEADSYVEALDDISKDYMEILQEDAKEFLKSKINSNGKVIFLPDDMKYLGSVLVSPIKITSSTTNYIYVVYSCKFKVDDEGFGEYEVVFPVRYQTILKTVNGYSYAKRYDYLLGDNHYFDKELKKYSVKGYESVATFFEAVNNKFDQSKYSVEKEASLEN